MADMVWLRDDDDTDGIKFLYTSCAECSYYGYSMSLWCLCGSGDDPNVYTPHTLELREFPPGPSLYQLASKN